MSDNVRLKSELHRKAAFEQFGETDELRTAKLIELRNLVNQIPYHPIIDATPNSLIKYLRGQRFDVRSAAQKIENLINFKLKYPHYFDKLDSVEFLKFKSLIHILPVRDIDNKLVILIRPMSIIETCTPEFIEQNPTIVTKINYFTHNYMSSNADAQIFGVRIINSFHEISLSQARLFRKVSSFQHNQIYFGTFLQKCSAIQMGKFQLMY